MRDPRRQSRSYADLILGTPGLVAYWRLGERSGTVARDSRGANHGAYVATPTLGQLGLIAGDGDSSVLFARASSQTVTATASGGGPVLTIVDNWTIEAWVIPSTSATTRAVFTHGTAATGYGIYIINTHRAWGYAEGIGDIVGSAGNPILSNTLSSHLVLTRSTTGRLYTNGVPVVGTTNTPITPVTRSAIGSEDGSALFFDGSIDEVAVYNRALTAAEVTEHYQAGRGS